MPLSKLAEKADVTEPYLEQILMALRHGGIIEASRGASGGYMLAKSPDEISVGAVLRVFEDGFEFVDCINGKCNHEGKCPTRDIWYKLYESINNCLDGINLADMVRGYNDDKRD